MNGEQDPACRVAARLSRSRMAASRARLGGIPPWCGECDETTRMLGLLAKALAARAGEYSLSKTPDRLQTKRERCASDAPWPLCRPCGELISDGVGRNRRETNQASRRLPVVRGYSNRTSARQDHLINRSLPTSAAQPQLLTILQPAGTRRSCHHRKGDHTHALASERGWVSDVIAALVLTDVSHSISSLC